MFTKKTFYPLLLVLLLGTLAYGQQVDYMTAYKEGRAHLDAGRYELALNSFARLMKTDPAHPVTAYTAFFYGVAAYNLGQVEKARDMFLQITRNHAAWAKMDEAYLWLSKVSFELASPNQGLYYAGKITDPSLQLLAEEIKTGYLRQLDVVTLEALLPDGDDARLIAAILAGKLYEAPLRERNTAYLDSLIVAYGLDSTLFVPEVPPTVHKEQYKVAVMLPLFVDRLWESGVYLNKTLAVDIYEGIKLALAEFDSSRITLDVYDTRKDSLTTRNILVSGKLADADAIIGPLYPQPLMVVNNYSYQHKLNYVNPVSTNSELIRDNPFAFLLRTGAESMGRIIAEHTHDKFTNKAYAIYYGTRTTDSLTAISYARRMALDSFYVAIIQQTQKDKAREIFDSLTSAIEVVDSAALQRMWNAGERVRFLPKKDSLLLRVDSLGHIFIASDNKAIASEVMAAVTSRGDTTRIVGVGNWFALPNAGLGLMEDLGVWLAMPAFEDMLLPDNRMISAMYRRKYHKKPGKYVFYGYYAMKFLGESLLNYGVYFQHGYKDKGNLDDKFDFAHSQDNLNLHLYTIEEGRVRKVDDHELD